MTSINFNAAATSALRTLQQSNSLLDATQNRISTGLKIGEAKDNAAYWSIATTMKSDNKALGTVKDALGLGAGTVDTMYQGLDAARSVLDDLKTKLTSSLNPSVDREAVQKDIDAYLSSLKSIAGSSVFSGENWLSVNSGVDGYSSSKQVVASYARAADGTVSIDTINIDTAKIALFDANADGNGIISSQAVLTAGGKELDFGGNAASGAAPALNGLDTATVKAGLDVGTAEKAKVSLGTFSMGGVDKADRLTFDLSVDGSAAKTITVKLATLTDGGAGGTGLSGLINAAIADATGFGSAVATAALVDGKVVLTSATTGSTSAISVSNLKAVDGDGTVTTTSAALTALNGAPKFGTGGATAVGVTFDTTDGIANGDKLKFSFTFNGDLYTTAETTLQAADAADESTYATKLQAMINNATRVSDGTSLGSGKVSVTGVNTSGDISISTVGVGPSQNVNVTDVKINGAAPAAGVKTANGLDVATGTAPTFNAATSGNIAGSAANGDTISLDITVYADNATATGSVATKKSISFVSNTNAATQGSNMQAALNQAFGVGVLSVDANGAITTSHKGPNAGFLIANIAVADGNGVKSSTLGLSGGAMSSVGRDEALTATKATVTSSSAFAGELTFDAGDSVSFNVKLNDVSKAVTINKALIDSTLGGSAGKITNANDYVTVVNAALANAGVASVTAKNDNGTVTFETNAAGKADLSITDVKSSSGANTVSVNEINITSASFKSLTNDQQTQLINAYINVVSDKLKATTSAASTMGSVAARIDSQKTFVSTLMDTIDKGVSGLVDADMNEESTKLQALQVKQQLGVQALSIANQSAQNVLRLFQ